VHVRPSRLSGQRRGRALTPALSASAQTAKTGVAAKGDPTLAKLLDRLVEANLERSPRQATSLGLDTGARAHLRSRLDDRSLAGEQREMAENAAALADLRRLDRGKLNATTGSATTPSTSC
jgi:uncharacterized protein (DUF885 family)